MMESLDAIAARRAIANTLCILWLVAFGVIGGEVEEHWDRLGFVAANFLSLAVGLVGIAALVAISMFAERDDCS